MNGAVLPARVVLLALGALVCVLLLRLDAAAGSASTGRCRNPTVGREVALQIPGMHRARVLRNVVYRRGEEGPLRMDVYSPRGSTRGRPLPAVLFVHGGTSDPSPKDWGEYVGWGQLAAASGLVGVTFNHTRGFTERDTRSAIAYVRSHARRLGIDPNRLCVKTHSAGAPSGVVAALSGSPPYIRCIVVYYGWLDAPNPRFSPLEYLKADPAKIPPMLVVKAGRDVASINQSIDRFLAAARTVQAPVELITYSGGQHAFDTRQHTRRSRGIIRSTLTFVLNALLGG